MKIWNGYGSEHSMNLVMIGHFSEAREAELVKELIERLTSQVTAEGEVHQSDAPPEARRFSDTMLELLRAAKLYTIGSVELEQLAYDVRVRTDGGDVVITTDESDVSAFLKVLIEKGARVEVYSAHNHTDTKYGRGR